MEEIDSRPQEIVEVGFEARVAETDDEGVEDVGDGTGGDAGVRQRARIWFVLERTVAIELEFGEQVLGRG